MNQKKAPQYKVIPHADLGIFCCRDLLCALFRDDRQGQYLYLDWHCPGHWRRVHPPGLQNVLSAYADGKEIFGFRKRQF